MRAQGISRFYLQCLYVCHIFSSFPVPTFSAIFGSFVVYCLHIFVLRVKLFLRIVSLFSFHCYFRVNSWLYFTGPV